MRNRGPSGGGTLRSESPQHGHRPSTQNARVASARSHWPRASHPGLMHCTVKPGRNCIRFPSAADSPSWHQSINGRVRDPNPPERMVCWRGFWPNPSRLSRKNTTTYSGPVAVCGVRRPSRRFAADYPTEQENNTARSNPNVPARVPKGRQNIAQHASAGTEQPPLFSSPGRDG